VSALHQTADRVLAHHREAGTPEAAAARAAVVEHLTALGYQVSTQPFRFHPSALMGLPIFGAGVGASALLALPLLTLPAMPGPGALVVWAVILTATICLAVGVAAGWVPLGPAREDANIIAVRSGKSMRRWIVAHLDSKAQAQSMAGRLVTVWLLAAAILFLTTLTVARLWGPLPLWLGAIGAALAIVAGALAGRGRLRGTSRGARDNGTGIVAALAYAEASSDPETGILITSGEEFGLVGSRIFARMRGKMAGVEVVNFDTIDDEGHFFLVSHDARGATLASELAGRLTRLGMNVRTRRLPIGILVDSLPFARAGAGAVTVGRLTWRTLRLIHTPADVPGTLSFDAAELIGRAIALN
jgi:Peptidase family M28